MHYCMIVLFQFTVLLYQDVVSYKLAYRKAILNRPKEEDFYKLPKDGELFEGDMIMNDQIRNAILGRKRAVGLSEEWAHRWKNGTIVYVNNITNYVGRQLLRKAIKEFEKRTCIIFKKRSDENDYVVYTDEKEYCSSDVGFRGGKQTANLGVYCNVLGTFLHETMHVLGIIHEHSRPDRDDHIKINWENIEKKNSFNFNKYSLSDVADEDLSYNFASVMHYRNNAFTKNGKDTIIAKNQPSLTFGQRVKFSKGDVRGINKLYHCKGKNDFVGLYDTYNERSIERSKEIKREKYAEMI